MKAIKHLLRKFHKYIKNTAIRIKKEHLIQEYFKNNILFVTFVVTAVINSTTLRFFCMHSLENYLSIKAILADTVVAMFIGSFAYLIKGKNKFILNQMTQKIMKKMKKIKIIY